MKRAFAWGLLTIVVVAATGTLITTPKKKDLIELPRPEVQDRTYPEYGDEPLGIGA